MMKLKDTTIYASAPTTVAMVLATMLVVVGIGQVLVVEIAHDIARYLRLRAQQSAEERPTPGRAALTAEQVRRRRIGTANKEFLPDGTLHLMQVHDRGTRHSARERTTTVQVFDTEGTSLFEGKQDDMPFEHIAWAKPIPSRRWETADSAFIRRMGMIGGEFSRWLMVPVATAVRNDPGVGRIIRYWQYQPGKRVFAGYDRSGTRIGYAGANGMVGTAAEAKPFERFQNMAAWCPPHSFSPVLFWLTEQRLYQIDFEGAGVETLLETGGGEKVLLGASNWRGLHTREVGSRPILCLVTADGQCRILLRQPHRQVSFQLPATFADSEISVGLAGDKLFVRIAGMEGGPAPRGFTQRQQWREKYRHKLLKQWVELHQITPTGEMSLLNRYEWTSGPWHPRWSAGGRTRRLRDTMRPGAMSASSPLFHLAWDWYYTDLGSSRSSRETNHEILAEVLHEVRPTNMATTLIVGLVMLAAAGWHGWARRTSWTKFAFWMLLVAAFNLAGLLTYLALNHRLVIRCPACNRKRGLRTPACRACDAPLPIPQPRGVDLVPMFDV